MSRTKMLAAGTVVIAAGFLAGAKLLPAQGADESSGSTQVIRMMGDSSQTWLGVQLKDVTPDQAREMKLGGEYGAMVKDVEKDSPAAKAGIQTGDVIAEFGGEKVRSVAELRRLVSETPAGRDVEIRVFRNGEEKTLNAKIEARNEGDQPLVAKLRDQVWPRINVPVYDFSFGFGGPRLGVAVDPLTPQLGEYFGVKDGKGVLVREVNPGSAAEKAGLKAGDCITKFDSTSIESANELHRALLHQKAENRDVTLTIVRDRKEQSLKVHLEPPQHPGARGTSDSGIADLIDAEKLEADARAWAPYAQDMEKYAADAQAQAKEAEEQAREFQKQWLNENGQWQQELKQLQPQMKEFQKQMKEFQSDFGSDVI